MPPPLGYLHLASDALHLTAAAAWFGGLVPLVRNTLIEIALGLSIVAMVGVLGTLHPAAHLVN